MQSASISNGSFIPESQSDRLIALFLATVGDIGASLRVVLLRVYTISIARVSQSHLADARTGLHPCAEGDLSRSLVAVQPLQGNGQI